ncbi:MAG: glutathione S-transferase family protein [Proteobacteria bacterium]|nr:glutathione S-transferase family protein [Pseudomonadota bacterium]
MQKSNIITVGYWSTKGLGSVCRMVVLYSGYSLKAKNYRLLPIMKDDSFTYDGSEWHEEDKINLKKRNSLINLPYIELTNSDGTELLISQSNACLSFLGRKFNMFGKNEVDVSQCEQLLLETNDLRNVITSFAYTHFKNKDLENEAAKDVFTRAFQNNNVGKIQKFENWMKDNQNNENYFLINNEITIPDFNLFDILDFYVEFLKYYNFVNDKNIKNIFNELGYPNISKFYNNFIQLPKMEKYLNSIFYKLTYTNKSARFGSGTQGDTWDHHRQIDETPKEIIIN